MQKVLLVQIRDEPMEKMRVQLAQDDEPEALRRAFSWIRPPIEGVFNAREMSMSFRNDELAGLAWKRVSNSRSHRR